MNKDLINGKALQRNLSEEQIARFISASKNFKKNTDALIEGKARSVEPTEPGKQGRKPAVILNHLCSLVQGYSFYSDLPFALRECIETCSLACNTSGSSLSNVKIFLLLQKASLSAEEVMQSIRVSASTARRYLQCCRLVLMFYKRVQST